MNFEVQEFTLCDGWINTWRDENDKPSYFDSEGDALNEVLSFLRDMQQAFQSGYMEDVPSISDYRIREVTA